MSEYSVICCVVNCGHGSKALRIAKRMGVRGGTICIGHGTVKGKRLTELLELTDIRKEIVWMTMGREQAREAMAAISHEMSFHRPHHGIAFSMALSGLFGVHETEAGAKPQKQTTGEEREGSMYQVIYTVVERGLGQEVVEAAKAGGARGATIINARGSGIHETATVFAMAIEPEKEMVMIVTAREAAEGIIASIRERMHIDEPGKGIIFMLDVEQAHGLY